MAATIIFSLFALLIMVASVMVVISKDTVVSAVFLVLDLFLLACMYAFLGADFIAVIQVLVYAGAILVLFMFVIMLLNLSPTKAIMRFSPFEATTLILSLVGFGALLLYFVSGEQIAIPQTVPTQPLSDSNTYDLGMLLFTKYIWPFELASILILLAVVASVLIAKREKTAHNQKEF